MNQVDWSSALSDPAGLRARGLFLAEGRLVLGRILGGAAGGAAAIVSVLSTPAAVQALDLEARVGERLATRSAGEMEALTGFNFHRGVLALVRRPTALAVDALIRDAIAGSTLRSAVGSDDGAHGPRGSGIAGRELPRTDRGARSEDRQSPNADRDTAFRHAAVLVVAEHLVDVDNVGSCFRNARAFAAAGVLLDDRCPDPLYRKAVRTSLGTVLEVPWVQAPIGDLMHALAAAGVVTVGLTPHPGAAPIADVAAELAVEVPVALVIGNEGHGLSAGTRAHCARLARIPMADGADSLNVATALAVALYEWRSAGKGPEP